MTSIVGPLLFKLVPKSVEEKNLGYWGRIKPYLALGAFSLLTAVLVVAFLGDTLGLDWRPAFVAGYAWDSTLQKVKA